MTVLSLCQDGGYGGSGRARLLLAGIANPPERRSEGGMARAASSLNHPNAVTVYEIGQAAGTWFIAAELIEGVTLREKRKQGKLPLASAIAIVAPCAAALHTAHRAGIPADVHQPPSSHLPHQSSRVPMRESAPVMRPAGRTPNLLPTPIYEMIRG